MILFYQTLFIYRQSPLLFKSGLCVLYYRVEAAKQSEINETYKPYTLVGPTVTRLVLDPLAVIHLDNQLYIPEQDCRTEQATDNFTIGAARLWNKAPTSIKEASTLKKSNTRLLQEPTHIINLGHAFPIHAKCSYLPLFSSLFI